MIEQQPGSTKCERKREEKKYTGGIVEWPNILENCNCDWIATKVVDVNIQIVMLLYPYHRTTMKRHL